MKALLIGLLFSISLCACSSPAPIKGIRYLDLSKDLAELEGFDGASEDMITRTFLNLNAASGGQLAKTDQQLFYLPETSPLHDGATLRAELQASLSDWDYDEAESFSDVTIVFTRKSHLGKQRLVATRIPLLANGGLNVYGPDAVLLLTLYPINE